MNLTIVTRKPKDNEGNEFVVIDRGITAEASSMRWVSATANANSLAANEWFWGHYFGSLAEAMAHYHSRHPITTHSADAWQLANAACQIADINHYLIGFHLDSMRHMTYDTFAAAHAILVERELQDIDHKQRYDLAFTILSDACTAVCNTRLP